MPLHLLGKKSWNVYSQVNIDRVRRDEAEATAAQELVDQRMQDEDAARRTAILRGETPPPFTVSEQADPIVGTKRKADGALSGEGPSFRQPRKKRSEDDTDLEMRLAREGLEAAESVRERLTQTSQDKSRSKPRGTDERVEIVDEKGHISLFAEPISRSRQRQDKDIDTSGSRDRKTLARENAERRERQKEDRSRQTEEDAGKGMKFSDAAGRGRTNAAGPWYAAMNVDQETTKDAFGNEDPNRKGRDAVRMSAMDPMAIMASAQTRLKAVTKEREDWASARQGEIDSLIADEKWRAAKKSSSQARREHKGRSGQHARHESRPRSRRSRSRSRERSRRERSPRHKSKRGHDL